MRELLRLADLLKQAKDAKTLEQLRGALIDTIEHLYHREYERERRL